MLKVLLVMIREYKATVMTKAFVFGAIIFPIFFYGLMFTIPNLVDSEAPKLEGSVAVFDATGRTLELIEAQFDPAWIEAQKDQWRKIQENEDARQQMIEEAQRMGGQQAALAVSIAGGRMMPLLDQPTPEIDFEPVTVDSESELESLRAQMQERIRSGELLAYLELPSDALAPGSKSIRLYLPPDMHQTNASGLEAGIRQGILRARFLGEGTPEMAQIKLLPPDVQAFTVTETGESESLGEAAFLVPLAFMLLLWISVFTGGQYLLMSTIEEKSSRVMEVVLSAISPLQMMSGKILGQGLVALTMLAVYAALGLSALDQFNLGYLAEPTKVAIVIPFFLMAFVYVACIMAAIGAAVTEVREANALMGPAMMILIVPFLVMMPIIESPNSTLAVVLSFIPPLTPFIMAMRLGSNQIIPAWEIVAALLVGFIAIVPAIWMTAKIFRIGALMYGKPPDLKTLVRWVRQA